MCKLPVGVAWEFVRFLAPLGQDVFDIGSTISVVLKTL
jgi:hypothetical protein